MATIYKKSIGQVMGLIFLIINNIIISCNFGEGNNCTNFKNYQRLNERLKEAIELELKQIGKELSPQIIESNLKKILKEMFERAQYKHALNLSEEKI